MGLKWNHTKDTFGRVWVYTKHPNAISLQSRSSGSGSR